MKPGEVDLDTALRLLALPREIGRHPEDDAPILAGIGRFGPYVKHGSIFKSLTADEDVLTVGLNRAVSVLAVPGKGRRGAPTPLRELGAHPTDSAPVALFRGRYGPYVSHGGLIASLPRGADPDALTLEAAVELLNAQAAKGKKPRRGAAAKPAKGPKAKAAKPAAKKPAAKPKKKAASGRAAKPAASASS
jgi:DNA topoisomerase-1